MQTLTLTGVVLELNPAQVNTQKQTPPPTPDTPNPAAVDVKILYVNGQFKIGDKNIAGYGNQFTLTGEDLKTTIDGVDDFALAKVKADLGIA